MSSETQKKWAVLVGIDCYSEDSDEGNLQGCVRDVKNVSQYLKADPLKVPPDHITTLVAAVPGQHNVEDDSKMRPTRAEIIKALKDVTGLAQPGDFVYFHYSGHGDVVPTIFGKDKSTTPWDEVLKTGTPWEEALKLGRPGDKIHKFGTPSDEVLCALDGDIRDVELGAYLDAMVEKGLLVLVVLDCCHSGGATRGNRGSKIRCRKMKPATASESKDSTKTVTANNTRGSSSTRNATVKESWFYRDREYNVIAACQPSERAWEYPEPNGQVHGVLTYCLIESLKSFIDSNSHHYSTLPITYKKLRGVLEARVLEARRGEIGVRQQQPMMLGDCDRIVFGAALDPSAHTAIITGTGTKSLTFDKGSAHGVCVNDRYKLLSLKSKVEVVVTEVQGLHSEAVPYGNNVGHSEDIQKGCEAMLVQRASDVHVKVLPTPEHSDSSVKAAFSYLQQNWQSFNIGIVRFDFCFDNETCQATFQISINQDCCCEIRNSQGIIMPNIAPLKADAPEMTKRVLDILQHLHSYQMLEGLKPPPNFKQKYQFSIEKAQTQSVEDGNGSAAQPWGSWEVKFKNLSKVPLFVTILNLSPAWGVHQIFPPKEDPESLAVEPSAEIPKLIIDMTPPTLWEALGTNAPHEMRDILKLFITTEQTSFSHYLLPNLGDSTPDTTIPDTKRNAKPRRRVDDNWFVEEIEILSKKKGQPQRTVQCLFTAVVQSIIKLWRALQEALC